MRLLVVIDYQHDFVDGSLGSKAAKDIYRNVADKIDEYSYDEDAYVVFTRDTHSASLYHYSQEGAFLPVLHCVYATKGWEIMDGLFDEENDHHIVFDKSTFGWPYWQDTLYDLIGIVPDTIEVIGVCTDICVVSNALALKACFPEAEMFVDAKCCAGTSEEAHKAALTVMKSCQIKVTE